MYPAWWYRKSASIVSPPEKQIRTLTFQTAIQNGDSLNSAQYTGHRWHNRFPQQWLDLVAVGLEQFGLGDDFQRGQDEEEQGRGPAG